MDNNIKETNIKYLNYIYWILIIISFQISYIIATKADDPNLAMPCNSENLSTKHNVKDIKAIFREIRTIAAHPEMVYIRLHDKEREIIKKRLPYEPHLELFLK